MVSQYPPLPFFDFSCNIPSPLTFWEAGGGNWAFRYIFKIGYDVGFGGLEKIVQQVKHHQNPSTPPPSPLGSQRNFYSVLNPPLL